MDYLNLPKIFNCPLFVYFCPFSNLLLHKILKMQMLTSGFEPRWLAQTAAPLSYGYPKFWYLGNCSHMFPHSLYTISSSPVHLSSYGCKVKGRVTRFVRNFATLAKSRGLWQFFGDKFSIWQYL